MRHKRVSPSPATADIAVKSAEFRRIRLAAVALTQNRTAQYSHSHLHVRRGRFVPSRMGWYRAPCRKSPRLDQQCTGLFGSIYLMPVFLAYVRAHNALEIGEIMLVTGVAQLIAAPVAAFLVRRVDERL